jgi:RND family efflux transporter MFP subunit
MPSRRTWLIAGSVAAAAAALAIVAGPGFFAKRSGGADAAAKPAPLVSIVRAESRDVAVKLATQGHVVALSQVDVRPQASGTIRGVHFHEGDEVKVGQLLFTIDASDVAAQLARAEATAAQIEAQVDDAERQLARTQELAKSNFYSSSAVDTIASKLESLQAQYKAAQADVASTKVLVARTSISAPIAGVTGSVAVHPGSLAQPAVAAPLVTVVQIDPIGVEFTLPESQLAALFAARAANAVRIWLHLPTGQDLEGKLVFVNNTVNPDSGTITLKAAFPNTSKTLWPGAYVEVRVDAGLSRGAIVLPPQAVLDGPQGRFVYVLDSAGKAQIRPVELLRIQDQMAVVSGLDGDERVVAEGQLGLNPGAAVRIAAAANAASGAVADARSSAPKDAR